ncbi:Hypothetical_protein [Hexamita inflata]|uniref:Hypothetical_protein n=1 Tax=Hexamita inflata TaxID=28002 RepID=A0AA86NT78_9EUKA|nr:Hypothetical protein HINF_LOCUS12563 [Hexamita inflata]
MNLQFINVIQFYYPIICSNLCKVTVRLVVTKIRIGKRQPLHCFLRNADGTTQVIPVQIGLHEAAALRPWMLVPESLVALAAEVRLTYIGVSKINDHSRQLTVPVQKTELERKLQLFQYIQQQIIYPLNFHIYRLVFKTFQGIQGVSS